MKEFMTQDELIDEFVEYLEDNWVIEKFHNDALGVLPRIEVGYKGDLLTFIKSAGKNSILDLSKLCNIVICPTTRNYRIACEFVENFNARHAMEIAEQYNTAVKLLARYTRECRQTETIECLYGSKEGLMEILENQKENLNLKSSFPLLATRYNITRDTTYFQTLNLNILQRQFTDYYTQNMGH